MGYSKSRKRINDIKPLLDIVLASEGKRVKIPSKNPVKFSYTIREMLKALERTKGEEKYSKILELYILRTKPDHIVFDPREKLEDEYENPIIELATSRQQLEVPDVNNVLAIVGACIKHKAPEMVFPDASLSDEDTTQLATWALKNGYTIASTNPLTLKRNGGEITKTSSSLNESR